VTRPTALAPGDRVSWNTSQGRTRGVVVEVRSDGFAFDGQRFTATSTHPAYIVESEKSGARAAHQRAALRRIPGLSRRA
jgi:hypothetical protein